MLCGFDHVIWFDDFSQLKTYVFKIRDDETKTKCVIGSTYYYDRQKTVLNSSSNNNP
mgnify:CR=1 FL=1